MANRFLNEESGPKEVPDLTDAVLREAFRAAEDPEVTNFLASFEADWEGGMISSPTGAWKEQVWAARSDEEIGRIEGHVLLELLAEGPMAVVFRAREVALDRIVALKMLSPGLAGNTVARDRFLREAKAAAGLVHENVLPIYRVGEEPLPYFTMRQVEGGTLQDRLVPGRSIPPDEWFSLARQVAGALGAAHAAGIIHRDVKPANLLFDEGGRLWVGDFGIAAPVSESSTSGDSVLGTPRYMSPEQTRGEELDGRSDLFALGGVLYRCLTGIDLVRGENPMQILASVESDDFAEGVLANEAVPWPQRRLLAGLLAHDREERFPDADSFLEALGVEEARISRSGISQNSRRRGLVALAAGILVLVVAAVPFSGLLRPENNDLPAAPAPSLPEIRIEGRDEVFRDFPSAFAAAPEGATLILDGVFVCREEQFGPEGRRLVLRSAPGAHAVVVAGVPGEHALFFRGPTELEGITFVRETGGENVIPIVGIYGGDAVVRKCRFETVMPGEMLLGSSLSFTNLVNATVDRCVFRTLRRDAIGIGYLEGSPPMNVRVKDSIFLSGVAVTRRIWSGSGALNLDWENSVVVADTFFLEHPRNGKDDFRSLGIRVQGTVLDLAGAIIHFGNGHSPVASGSFVEWTGERNRHPRPGLRVDWTGAGEEPSPATFLEVSNSGVLAPPLRGREISPKIAPFVKRGSETATLEVLFQRIRQDPAYSRLLEE